MGPILMFRILSVLYPTTAATTTTTTTTATATSPTGPTVTATSTVTTTATMTTDGAALSVSVWRPQVERKDNGHHLHTSRNAQTTDSIKITSVCFDL